MRQRGGPALDQNDQEMDKLAAEVSAHELDTVRRMRVDDGLTGSVPQRPQWILESLSPSQRHTPPRATVELHEPRSTFVVPQELQHEDSSPTDAREELLSCGR